MWRNVFLILLAVALICGLEPFSRIQEMPANERAQAKRCLELADWHGESWCRDHLALVHEVSMDAPTREELCLELSDWVGEGEKWRFLVAPERERLPFIMMIKTTHHEQTMHFLESNILASGPDAARQTGPDYHSKAAARAAFLALCQRLGRKS